MLFYLPIDWCLKCIDNFLISESNILIEATIIKLAITYYILLWYDVVFILDGAIYNNELCLDGTFNSLLIIPSLKINKVLHWLWKLYSSTDKPIQFNCFLSHDWCFEIFINFVTVQYIIRFNQRHRKESIIRWRNLMCDTGDLTYLDVGMDKTRSREKLCIPSPIFKLSNDTTSPISRELNFKNTYKPLLYCTYGTYCSRSSGIP